MKPFFHSEGFTSPSLPVRPHFGGSGLSSSSHTHPPPSLYPHFEAFGLFLTHGEGAAVSTARRAARPGAALAKRLEEGLVMRSCPLLAGLLHASLPTACYTQPNIIKGFSTR